MKFTIIRSKFLESLKSVQNIVASKGTLQILQNVLLVAKDGQLFMTTTDLDISVRSVVACEIESEGATTLPVKLLFSTISKVAEGQVVVDVDEQNHATISAGSAIFKLAGMPVSDFPALPVQDGRFVYTISQSTFREMLRKTAYAASQDETRKTLKGVLMSFKDGKLTMVATDGRRLALVEQEMEFPAEAEQDIVLPTKAVAELTRSLSNSGDLKITVQNSQVSFDLSSTQVYSKLLDDVYPNYRQVIPGECAERVIIERRLLLDALDRVSVMTTDQTSPTCLIFAENQLTVSSNAADVGEARDIVPIRYAGPKIEIMFNATYVMDPLKAIDEDEITIELNDGHSPALIKCAVPFLYVLMPLRLS